MKEFYLLVTACGVFFGSLSNNTPPAAGPHHNLLTDTLPTGAIPDLESMIPVQAGDTFSVRVDLPGQKSHPLLTNGLRALGAGTAAYGLTQHESESDKKIAPVARRSYILPVIGTGIALSAGKLAHLGKGVNAYFKYTLYDKHLNVVSNGVIPLSSRMLKKGQPVFTGTAPEDGYLEAKVVSNDPVAFPIKAIPSVTLTPKSTVIPDRSPAVPDRALPGFVSNTDNLIARPTADMPVMRPKSLTPASRILDIGDVQHSGVKTIPVPAIITIPAAPPSLPAKSLGKAPSKLPNTPSKPIFHKFIPYYEIKREDPGDEEGGEGGSVGEPDPGPLELFDEDDDDDDGGGGDDDDGGGDGGGGDGGGGDGDDDDSDDDDSTYTEEDSIEESGDADTAGGDPRFPPTDVFFACDLYETLIVEADTRRTISANYTGVKKLTATAVDDGANIIYPPGGGYVVMTATANSPYIVEIFPPLPNPGPLTVVMACNVTQAVFTYNAAGNLVNTTYPPQYTSYDEFYFPEIEL